MKKMLHSDLIQYRGEVPRERPPYTLRDVLDLPGFAEDFDVCLTKSNFQDVPRTLFHRQGFLVRIDRNACRIRRDASHGQQGPHVYVNSMYESP